MSVIYINPYFFGDPNFANVSLLLHGNGTNGSTTIIDSSSSPKTVTAVNGAAISTAQSKPGFGGSSIFFDATNDVIDVPYSSAFDLRDNWTVEWWSYVPNVTNNRLSAALTVAATAFFGGQNFTYVGSSIHFDVRPATNGANINVASSTGVIIANTWQHIAYCAENNSMRIFVDGSLVAGPTSILNITFTPIGVSFGWFPNRFTIGGYKTFDGYMDDIRVTKGVARYTAAFTPSTAPFPDA